MLRVSTLSEVIEINAAGASFALIEDLLKRNSMLDDSSTDIQFRVIAKINKLRLALSNQVDLDKVVGGLNEGADIFLNVTLKVYDDNMQHVGFADLEWKGGLAAVINQMHTIVAPVIDRYCLNHGKRKRMDPDDFEACFAVNFRPFDLLATSSDIARKHDLQIVLKKSKPYSSLSLEDIGHLLFWGNDEKISRAVVMANFFSGASRKDPELCNVNPVVSTTRLAARVEFIETYLILFRDSLNNSTCFSEANRRWLINIFVLAATASLADADAGENTASSSASSSRPMKDHVEASLSSEHIMQLGGHRVGNGPLDYFVTLCDDTRLHGITTTAVVRDRAPEEDEEEQEEAGEVESNERSDSSLVVEAKTAKAVAEDSYLQSFCQLMGQMMDACKLSSDFRSSKAAKLDASLTSSSAGVASSFSPIASVKGVLSTGQSAQFFSMKHANGRFRLKYHGTFELNILPREAGGRLGLDAGAALNLSEVQELLIAYYNFYRLHV